jgi:hypothetical protein
MTDTERNFRALAKLFGLNVRKIWVNDPDTFELSMGEAPGGAGSYGLDSVVRYVSWADRYTAPSFFAPLRREDVAIHVQIWQTHRDPAVSHPHYREYLLREATGHGRAA